MKNLYIVIALTLPFLLVTNESVAQPLFKITSELDSLRIEIQKHKTDTLSPAVRIEMLERRIEILEAEHRRLSSIYDYFESKLVMVQAAEQVNLRESPGSFGTVYETIAAGDRMTIHGYDEVNNRYITKSKYSGVTLFALPLAFYIPDSLYFGQGRYGAEPPPARPSTRVAQPERGTTQTTSGRTSQTSVQCKGQTQKGARCRNMTRDASGYCHLHKR